MEECVTPRGSTGGLSLRVSCGPQLELEEWLVHESVVLVFIFIGLGAELGLPCKTHDPKPASSEP